MKNDPTGPAPLGRPIFAEDGAGPAASALRLREETRHLAGLAAVQVEERLHPLWLRAGTADAERAIAMLDLATSGLNCAHAPRVIVEIGAGAGYRSVALAVDYPEAEILAIEPDPAWRRTGLLNTLAYDNITYLTAPADRGWAALPGAHGLAAADTLILAAVAASAGMLDEPLPAALRLIAVETGGRPLPPELARGFPLPRFVTVISGDYVLLHRRGVPCPPPAPRRVELLAFDGPARYFRLENTGDGFLALPGGGARLQPNPSGSPPARFTLSAELRGHAILRLSLRGAPAAAVRVMVHLFSDAGTMLASGSTSLRDGAPRQLDIALPLHHGRCEAVFSTEMAESGTANAGAWAEITAATLI